MRHHGILAHGLGVQAIRANTPGDRGGTGGKCRRLCAGDRDGANIEAARKATRDDNAPFLTALMEGSISRRAICEREGANAPKVEPGDMKAIGSPLDFVGLNVYTPHVCSRRRLRAGIRNGA